MLDRSMRLLSTLVSVFLLAGPGARAQEARGFEVQEATILQIHTAMREGRLTCRGLVESYLRRIEMYDKNGPAINAIVLTNPEALTLADDLDRQFKARGPVGPWVRGSVGPWVASGPGARGPGAR